MNIMEWRCPFCNHDTIVQSNHCENLLRLELTNAEGPRIAHTEFIVCPNPNCKKISLAVELYEGRYTETSNSLQVGAFIKKWVLVPPSEAKAYPDYVPKAITDDYTEAYLVKDLSPKASATLSRRCLQGMIRNFWNVTKKTLVDEIEAIKDKVDNETWNAIDSVRKIGNIGAHMESDINIIVDVDDRVQ